MIKKKIEIESKHKWQYIRILSWCVHAKLIDNIYIGKKNTDGPVPLWDLHVF